MKRKTVAKDFKKLEKTTGLFSDFAGAIRESLPPAKLQALTKAGTRKECDAQFRHMDSALKFTLAGAFSKQDDALAVLYALHIRNIFARAALRVETREALASMAPAGLARPEIIAVLEKYKLNDLAKIARAAAPK
jgi:hypothetical protein